MFFWFVVRNLGLCWACSFLWFSLVELNAPANRPVFLGSTAVLVATGLVCGIIHCRRFMTQSGDHTWSRLAVGIATSLVLFLFSIMFFFWKIGRSIIESSLIRAKDQWLIDLYNVFISKVPLAFGIMMLILGLVFAVNFNALLHFGARSQKVSSGEEKS